MPRLPLIALLSSFIAAPSLRAAAPEASAALKQGDAAPAFEAKTDAGRTVKLSDFRGKSVVLYFYPKDDTPGCTAEACSFRDNFSGFKKRNAVILGVSLDDAASHGAFKGKYKLPFPLLADVDGKLSRAYGVLPPGAGHASRWTFVIDPRGKIKKIFPNVNVDGHTPEVLAAL